MSDSGPVRFYLGTADFVSDPRLYRRIWPNCSKCGKPLRGEVVSVGERLFHEGCYETADASPAPP